MPARTCGSVGVYRYVERPQSLIHNPGEVEFREPRKGREVAVQEGQPVVVVLEVERLPHPGGKLIDEAELAMVVACLHPVEDRRIEPQSDRRSLRLRHLDRHFEAPAAQQQLDVCFVYELLVVDHVGRPDAVDREQLIADRNTCGRGWALWNHFENRRITT